MLSTKKWYSSFLKKVLLFLKIYFKVKVLKMFKIFTDCHIKSMPISQTEGYFSFFRTYALSVGFKMEISNKKCFPVLDKNQLKFCCKFAERSNHSFLLPIWWITFFQTSVILIRVMECIEHNWLYIHMKKVRSSQAANLVLHWAKKSFSLWVSLIIAMTMEQLKMWGS